MADDVLFEVDASQIIVKLHFAGLQATRSGYDGGAFFVNTGIRDDNPSGTPDDIGKTRFDLTNKDGAYQVGWVKPIHYEYEPSLDNAMQDIEKLDAMTTSEGNKGLLASQDKKDEEKRNTILNLQNSIKSIFNSNKIGDVNGEMLSTQDGIKKAKDMLSKHRDENANESSFVVAFDEAKGDAVKFLSDYMKSFAGAGNSNVDESVVGSMQVSNSLKGPNDKGLVQSFEIQPISPQERGKVEAEAKANPKDAVKTYCFYVNYSLNVEK